MKTSLIKWIRILLIFAVFLTSQNCSNRNVSFQGVDGNGSAFGFGQLYWDQGSWDERGWSDE